MTLDFVGFINDSVVNLTPEQKLAMLDDFCTHFRYVPAKAQRAWANLRIEDFIKSAVNATREGRAAESIERLVFDALPPESEPA